MDPEEDLEADLAADVPVDQNMLDILARIRAEMAAEAPPPVREPADPDRPNRPGLPQQTVVGSIGRGIAAGPVSLAQGVTELGAAASDAVFGTDFSRRVTEAFEGFKDEYGLVPERTAGKIAEEITAFGLGFIPVAGWLGRASAVSRGAAVAPARSVFLKTADEFGLSSAGRALLGSRVKLGIGTALSAGIYDAAVSWEGRGTVSDAFEALPDILKTEAEDEALTAGDEAFRRLRNKARFGAEGVIAGGLFEAAFPVFGAVGRALARTPGVPQTARAVHTILFDKLGSKLGEIPWLKRNFTSAGNLPPGAHEALEDVVAIQGGASAEAVRAIERFSQAAREAIWAQRLKGRRSFDIKEAREDLMAYLTGDFEAFRAAAPMRGYRPKDIEKLEAAGRDMRAQIDNLSDMLAKEIESSKALSNEDKVRILGDIEQGLGSYIRRLYDAFDNPTRYLDPKMYETPAYTEALDDVTRILTNNAKAALDRRAAAPNGITADEYMLELAEIEARTPELARQVIDDIANGGALSSARPFDVALKEAHQHIRDGLKLEGKGRVQLNQLAQGLFTERVPLLDQSAPLRRFLGEITDPEKAFFRTVEDLAQTTTNLRLYQSLKDQFVAPVSREMFEAGAARPLAMSIDDLTQMSLDVGADRLARMGLDPNDPANAFRLFDEQAKVLQNMTKGYTALPGPRPINVEGSLFSVDPKQVFGPYGALSNHYVRNDLYEALTTPVRAHALLPDLWSAALMVKGLSQMTTVVLNPVAHVRDALGHLFTLGANGNLHKGLDVIDSTRMVFAQLANMDNAKYREALTRYEALGLVDQSVVARELSANRLDAKNSMDPDSWLASWQRGIQATARFMSLGGKAEKLYAGTDAVAKIAGMLAEQSKYTTAFAKAGLDIDRLSEAAKQALVDAGLAKRTAMTQGPRSIGRFSPGRPNPVELRFSDVLAADLIKDTMPSYSRVPEFIKSLRRLPLGNFISFPAEIIRNSANIVDRGLRELGFKASPALVEEIGPTAAKALERELRAIGASRLTAYSTVALSVPTAVQAAAMRATGMGEEEMDALYQQVAPWFKGHVLLPTSWDGRGRVEFVDYSYMNPWDIMLAPARAALQQYNETGALGGDEITQIRNAAMTALKTFIEPFASEAMMVERLMDVLPQGYGREGRTALGAFVYRPEHSLGEKMTRSFAHLVAGVLPQYSQYFVQVQEGLARPGTLLRSIYGLPDNLGRKTDMFAEAAALVTGVRGNEVNLRDTFNYTGYEYGQMRASIDAGFRRAAMDPRATPESVVEAFIRGQEQRFRAQSALFGQIEAARALGMTDKEIRLKLQEDPFGGRGGNLGKRELALILKGQFDALRPSDQLTRNILRESRNPERFRLMDRLNRTDLIEVFREWNRRSLDPSIGYTDRHGNPWKNGPSWLRELAEERGLLPAGDETSDSGSSDASILNRSLGAAANSTGIGALLGIGVGAQPAVRTDNVGGLLGPDPVSAARNASLAG